jgi:segregation and condensation protein B
LLLSIETNGIPGNSDNVEIKSDNTSEKQTNIYKEIIYNYNIEDDFFDKLIAEINTDLLITNRPFQIVQFAGGWQFATRAEYGELVHRLIKSKSNRRLTQASLEVLAIVAYKQPVTKPEIDQIRGVNSGDVINSLIEKNLLEIVGRRKTLGKPLLYGTTINFLKTFGLNSIDELPELRQFDELADTAQIFIENNTEHDNEITITDLDDNEIQILDIINIEDEAVEIDK